MKNLRNLTFSFLISFALLSAAACKSGPKDQQAAIRRAVEIHLAQRGNLNMAGMDMEIKVDRMDQRTADITVMFRARQGGGAMQMGYVLERQGDGWIVKGSRSGMGGGHPAVGSDAPPGGGMPSAHPPIAPPQPAPQQPTKRP
jgi:hypothetical protein